jgi:poly(A) polymerase
MSISDRLPPAQWTQRADLARLVATLGAGNARWVGGAVRDTLLGIEAHDVDCATPLPPRKVMDLLEAAGIRCIPTGIDHGTVTALLADGNVEITTLRRDVATDGRRAEVAFSDDWQEDAARRDFTINALYAEPDTGVIHDYFGGLDDLRARRVRFIGDPHDRIREDHLRILRYFRFHARFGNGADAAAEAACQELAPTLKGLSRERVAMELLNLLALADPAPTMRRMHQLDVLPVILPEATLTQLDALGSLVAHEAAEAEPADPVRRLGALLPPDPEAAQAVAARLRLSAKQRKRLACIAARNADDAIRARPLAYRVGLDCARDRLLLAGSTMAPLKDWAIPAFPLKGGEIVARGVRAGPDVARIMQAVERHWVDEGFPDRRRVEELLQRELDQ